MLSSLVFSCKIIKQLISFSERRETDKAVVAETGPEYDEVAANDNNRNKGICLVVCSENLSFDELNLALLVIFFTALVGILKILRIINSYSSIPWFIQLYNFLSFFSFKIAYFGVLQIYSKCAYFTFLGKCTPMLKLQICIS